MIIVDQDKVWKNTCDYSIPHSFATYDIGSPSFKITVVNLDLRNDVSFVGVAVCSTKDNNNEEKGRIVAYNRAVHYASRYIHAQSINNTEPLSIPDEILIDNIAVFRSPVIIIPAIQDRKNNMRDALDQLISIIGLIR